MQSLELNYDHTNSWQLYPSSALQAQPDHTSTHNIGTCTRLCREEDHHEDDAVASNFDCNICLDVCYEPVVTMCGHLFCWPCLYNWLFCSTTQSVSKNQICPVCKQNVEDMMVIPLYGRGRPVCAEYLAERFSGIHVPCRPSPPCFMRKSSQFAYPNYILEQVHNVHHDRNQQLHPVISNQSLNLCLSRLYYLGHSFMLVIPASSYTLSRFFCAGGSWTGAICHLLAERRRFNNEKEFVLHWGFIVFALLATLAFALC